MAIILCLRPFVLVSILFGLFSSFNQNGIIPAVNAGANVEIQGPSLHIFTPPPLKLSIKNPHVPHFLPCSVGLDTKVTLYEINYFWYHNEKKLQLKVGRRSNDFEIYSNGTLRIPPKEKSKGVYHCQINGSTSVDNVVVRSTNSYVDYPILKRQSEWNNGTKIKSELTANIGSFFTIPCPIESIPHANFTWLYENINIYEKFHQNSFVLLTNGSLVIKNINENHKGKYKCYAENVYANKTHRHFVWSLSVKPPQSNRMDPKTGKLLPHLQSEIIYITPGKMLHLICDGNTDTIKWSFKSKPNDTSKVIQKNSKKLILSQVSIHNSGFYSCSTASDSQTYQVIVTIPPKIENPLKSFLSSLSATITISCNATGRPDPEIIWYRNGVRLNNSYTVQFKSNPAQLKLMSFDVADEGTYQCFAKNIAGEVYSAGQLNLRSSYELHDMIRKPENLQCYPVNYKTVKISFINGPWTYMAVNIVTENPYEWKSIIPMDLTSISEITISESLPILESFVVLLRGLYQTSVQTSKKGVDKTMESSLLSDPIHCATQGLPVHAIKFSNGIFLWWSRPNITNIEYFVIQFLYYSEEKQPLFEDKILGTTSYVPLRTGSKDSHIHFVPIPIISDPDILENFDFDSNSTSKDYMNFEPTNLYNLILPGNTTGILITENFKINVRVLLVTEKNVKLKQNLTFLEWKFIDTISVVPNDPWQIIETDGRNIKFALDKIEKNCIKACIKNILEFHIIQNNQDVCMNIRIKDNSFWIRGVLKPQSKYRITFFDCESNELWGDTDVATKADPPGPISNQNIIWENGLKLCWSPPINPNGQIYYYVIMWTLQTSSFEANVTDRNWFVFPNVTEHDKIKITIYVVGESGVGSPIYIDVKNNIKKGTKNNQILLKETYWPAILGGGVLSVGCVIVFVLLFLYQRRKFKQRSIQSQCDPYNSNTETYTTTVPSTRDDLPRLGVDCTIHEYYEMETLIPRSIFSNLKSETNGQIYKQPKTINSNEPKHGDDNLHASNNDIDFNVGSNIHCTSTPLSQKRKEFTKFILSDDQSIVNNLSSKNFAVKKLNRKSYEQPVKISPTSKEFVINKIKSSPNFFGNNNPNQNNSSNNLENDFIFQKDILENNCINNKQTFKTNSNANLPPLKHSLSTLELPTLPTQSTILNGDCDNNDDDNHLQNASTSENSRNLLLSLDSTNLDSNKYKKCKKKNSNTNNNNTYELDSSILNSTNTKSAVNLDSNDMTTTTLLNITTLDDKEFLATNHVCPNNTNNIHLVKTNSIGNKINWGCRPLIDPNG